MLLWATICGLLIQVLAARLGVVTGKNLAQMCRLEFSRPVRLMLRIMTEIAIIGSDIQDVVRSAIALKLLFGIPLWGGCLITGLDTFTFLIIHHFGVRKLEALFAALIFTMMVCFFIIFVQTRPVWLGAPWDPDGSGIILGTLVPTTSDFAVVQAVGILGAVIMPHNIYLHSALVQSRKINRQDHTAVAEACKYNAIESAIALGVSYLINAAVVTVFARGFFNKEVCARPGLDINTFTGGAGAAAADNGSANLSTGKDRYGRARKTRVTASVPTPPTSCLHQPTRRGRCVLSDRASKHRSGPGGTPGAHGKDCVGGGPSRSWAGFDYDGNIRGPARDGRIFELEGEPSRPCDNHTKHCVRPRDRSWTLHGDQYGRRGRAQ